MYGAKDSLRSEKTRFFLYFAFWRAGQWGGGLPGHATAQTLKMLHFDFISSLLLLVSINEMALNQVVFQSFGKEYKTAQYLIFRFFV